VSLGSERAIATGAVAIIAPTTFESLSRSAESRLFVLTA
jgi:hypothetical protein